LLTQSLTPRFALAGLRPNPFNFVVALPCRGLPSTVFSHSANDFIAFDEDDLLVLRPSGGRIGVDFWPTERVKRSARWTLIFALPPPAAAFRDQLVEGFLGLAQRAAWRTFRMIPSRC
jgi:hypothetical protein